MGTLKTWTVLDLGCDGSQYFPGDTAAFSSYDVAEVGVGDTAREALEDALDSMAQDDIEVPESTVAQMLTYLSNPDASAFAELDHSECDEDHMGDDWNHYVSIRYTLEP